MTDKHTPEKVSPTLEPAFHCERECTCSLSIYPNKGTTIADFSVLGDQAPGVAWVTCATHAAALELLKALERAKAQALAVIRSLEDWPGSDPHRSMKRIEPTFGRIVEIKACITSLHDIDEQARDAIYATKGDAS